MAIQSKTEATETGAYAEVNGVNLYYESHGTGRPLILLHGGLASGEMFGPILPALSASHRVVSSRPAGSRAYRRHRSADRHPAHGRRHRGPHRRPRA